MNKTEYFEFAEKFFNKCVEVSRKKNADYTGGNNNPFSNFESVEVLGIGTAQGFLTRMMDKMKRVASFVENGELLVKDESVTDTLNDLANYSCLLAGWIESQKSDTIRACHSSDLSLIQKVQIEYFDGGEGNLNFPLYFLDNARRRLDLPNASHSQINDMLVNLLEK